MKYKKVAELNEFNTILNLQKARYDGFNRADVDVSSIMAVEMDQAAVTYADAPNPALGTQALVTCLGIFVYNANNQALGLCHLTQEHGAPEIWSREGMDELRKMLSMVSSDENHKLEARLVGMNSCGVSDMSKDLVNDILQELDQHDCTVISADILKKPGPGDVAADARAWDQGLMRGNIDRVDFFAMENGRNEMYQQSRHVIDLSQMSASHSFDVNELSF